MLGTLGGAGLGIFDALGSTPPAMLLSAAMFGLYGFIGGSVVGAFLGLLSVLYITIFRRQG